MSYPCEEKNSNRQVDLISPIKLVDDSSHHQHPLTHVQQEKEMGPRPMSSIERNSSLKVIRVRLHYFRLKNSH
jgi:hypothetical protein